ARLPSTAVRSQLPPAPDGRAPPDGEAETADALISPPKIETDATSAAAFAAAFCMIAVDADALVAPVVITEPSPGYEKPEVSDGLATGGATTVAVPPPSAPGTTTRTAHAWADAPGVRDG